MMLSSGSAVIVVASGAYLLVGVVIAVVLVRQGRPAATVGSAVVVWPLLLPLLMGDEARATPDGPMASRIDAVFGALLETLSDPAASEVPWEDDVQDLWDSLHRADQRLGLADRLLEQEDGGGDPEVARTVDSLRKARQRAASEIEAVLAGVTQLRIHVGLESLAGDTVPVLHRLRELRARVSALEEVTELSA